MLEKPNLADERIVAGLQKAYGLSVAQVDFLPLGADQNTAVYRVVARDATHYFLKLRRDDFDEIAVALPRFLADQGIASIIPPLATLTGQLWATLDLFSTMLYPYIDGGNGYAVALTDRHWIDFDTTIKQIQTARLPQALRRRLPQETFSARWRDALKDFLDRIEYAGFVDPVAIKMAAFLKTKRGEVFDLIDQAEQFARALTTNPPKLVLCHSDLHAGNILIDHADRFYIVDWDNPMLAPKERDLMYAGGGQFGETRTAQEEEALFYRGYGQTPIDPVALAYYRYERIIEDMAVECAQIFKSDQGGADREQALRYLISNFAANGAIAIARGSAAARAAVAGKRFQIKLIEQGDFIMTKQTFLAQVAVTINASAPQVWKALTNPDLIKQYLFGTQVETDWRVGSPITYRGVWEGKSYEDKGKILQIEPNKLLVSTFWSSMGGKPDLPENYQTLRYELTAAGNATRLTIIQDNSVTQQDAEHSEQNWKMVLDGLKKLVEG